MSAAPVKVGIIGGTGLEDPEIFTDREEKKVTTPFGDPSDGVVVLGKIAGVDCVLIARHGKKHTIAPTQVNYRANVYALKQEGCTHLIVGTACGSLREEIAPGDLVFIDQVLDRTTSRKPSFYDGSVCPGVGHVMAAEPFCPKLRAIFTQCAKDIGLQHHNAGTMVSIEGPRFSTKAESKAFRMWGGDVINMTTAPEVFLAAEVGLPYAAVAMATDYDCWRESEEAVSVELILKTLKENADRAKSLFLKVVPALGAQEWTEHLKVAEQCARGAVLPGGKFVMDTAMDTA